MIVIETIEVLVRQYELNSIDNNNSYTTRNRNRERMAEAKAKSQAKMETEEAKMEAEKGEDDDDDDENKSSKGSEINQSADKEATGSLKREEPEESREGEEEKEEKQQSTGMTLFVPSENVMRSISSMVLSKGEHIGRGHTAYLTFATKL